MPYRFRGGLSDVIILYCDHCGNLRNQLNLSGNERIEYILQNYD